MSDEPRKSRRTGAMASPPTGLSAAEAAKRLGRLGIWERPGSRSVASIVAGNVLTVFNGIILGFFVLILSLGLWADALFGFVAIINTTIGIRQELKAKRTLDELALLVAPQAKVLRDGEVRGLTAEQVVPGDIVRLEPGDQLLADGEVIDSRGLTVDESLLTGESDGIRKGRGDRVMSGSFVVSGSGYCGIEAVRDDCYAERLSGEARQFRHPKSPLEQEVNRILLATLAVMVPLGLAAVVIMNARSVPFQEAAQTATAGLITLVPEGLVLLLSVTLAVAAVRLARIGALVQQINATESLAAVDTICVDKTGTLTSGELRMLAVEAADGTDQREAEHALARFAASAGVRNRTLEAIADRLPATPERPVAEVPFSSEWKWSGLKLNGGSRGQTFVIGAPDILIRSGALELSPSLRARLDEHTRTGRRVLAFATAVGELPADPAVSPAPQLNPKALVVLEETLRPDAVDAVEFMRDQQVDLKLISGDARATVTAVATAVGIPADVPVIDGPSLPADEAGLRRAALEHGVFCRITPDQKKALVGALADAGRYTAMIGDGVNDVPALKRARLAVAMGSGSQITKGIADIVLLQDSFATLPRAVAEGRRIARNVHRLARLYMTKSVYAGLLLAAVVPFGWTFPFLPRHLTIAATLTIGIPSFVLALAPSDGPLYRGRLLRSLLAFAGPAGVGIGVGSLLSFFLVDTIFGGSVGDGRTAATTTLIVLGLAFVLLLERGPGRESIHISSYMLALVSGLGALMALAVAAGPVRDFFELEILTAGQWFLALLSVAAGLVVAGAIWRLPQITALEAPDIAARSDEEDVPEPTHRPVTSELPTIRMPGGAEDG